MRESSATAKSDSGKMDKTRGQHMAQAQKAESGELDEIIALAKDLLAQGLSVGLVAMDEPVAEWVEMQRQASALQRGGERVVITGGGGTTNGQTMPFKQTRRKWTTSDELTRIIRHQKATDPHAGGGSGPRNDFNPATGDWG